MFLAIKTKKLQNCLVLIPFSLNKSILCVNLNKGLSPWKCMRDPRLKVNMFSMDSPMHANIPFRKWLW